MRVVVLSLLGLAAVAAGSGQRADAPPHYPDKTRLLVYRDAGGREHPVKTPADWAKRRAHILAHMQEVMGPLPDAARKVPLDVQIIEETKEEKFIRKKLTFAVEKDDRVPAYLLVPHTVGPASRAGLPASRAGLPASRAGLPAVLCLHQTTKLGKAEPAGLGPDASKHYAKHLAERGYVTLAPDYPNFGDYRLDVYQRGYASATMKGIWNHMRAVDLLASLPQVDAERIGVIGHSLGGHNSLFVAAFDERIRCIVSNCGFCSFPTYYKGDLKGWSHNGYMPRIRTVYELKPEKMPFDFPEVVAALAPRPFLAIAPVRDGNFDMQGVKDCLAAAGPVYDLLGAKDILGLAGHYPDCGHEFPEDVRKVAYEWIDRSLRR